MDKDSYEIGLGNFDTKTRTEAETDFISFWGIEAKNLSWYKQWQKILDWNSPFAKWFINGKINASYNVLDIHQKDNA